MEEVNKMIRQLREQKGLTQQQMADLLFIGRSAYTKLESGFTKLDVGRLIQIARVHDVSPWEIIKTVNPNPYSVPEQLSIMLDICEYNFSKMYAFVPFEALTDEQHALLREKGLDSKEAYENTPKGGRIYQFGPRELFKYMVENCGMEALFRCNLVTDSRWIKKWEEYLLYNKWKIMPGGIEVLNNEEVEEEAAPIQIDTHDYFVVFSIVLTMSSGEERHVQVAEREFPEWLPNPEDVLDFLMKEMGATDGDVLAWTNEGYDPYTEIIHVDALTNRLERPAQVSFENDGPLQLTSVTVPSTGAYYEPTDEEMTVLQQESDARHVSYCLENAVFHYPEPAFAHLRNDRAEYARTLTRLIGLVWATGTSADNIVCEEQLRMKGQEPDPTFQAACERLADRLWGANR